MDFHYDVFISYSHEDVVWAKKLSEALKNRNIKIFLDDEGLRAGDAWEETLIEELKASRHLVVLWSAKAKNSVWVLRECGHFDAISSSDTKRRLICVLLDGTQEMYPSFQSINEIKDANVYPGKPDAKHVNYWNRVLERLEEAIESDSDAIPISLAVLAMTKDQLEHIDPKKKTIGGTLSETLKAIGLETVSDLAEYYGPERTDWRPFAGKENIHTIMRELESSINKLAKAHHKKFRWVPVSDDFWSSDPDEILRAAAKLASGPSVVVVDPLSLYDDGVERHLGRLRRQLERNDQAAVMILAPFASQGRSLNLRSVIRSRAEEIFDHVYALENLHPSSLKATCGIGLVDLVDMRRVLLPALRQELRAKSPDNTHEVLKVKR